MTTSRDQFGRWSVLMRMFAAVAICLLMLTAIGPRSTSAQTEGDAAQLDARVGGSVAAFEEKYGEPINDPGTRFDAERAYENKDYRNLIALAVDETIYSVVFSADIEEMPADERKTWALSKAKTVAKRFLPKDVECAAVEPLPGGEQLRAQCTSAVLTESWSSPDYEDANRAGPTGTASFTLTLHPDDPKKVTDIAVAVGTMSLAEANAATAYLKKLKETYDELPETFGTMDATIRGEQTNDQVLIGTFLIWLGAYGVATSTEPPAQYTELHEQWTAILKELNLAAESVMSGSSNDDAEAVRTGVGHYYVAVGLYEVFKPVMNQALADAGLL